MKISEEHLTKLESATLSFEKNRVYILGTLSIIISVLLIIQAGFYSFLIRDDKARITALNDLINNIENYNYPSTENSSNAEKIKSLNESTKKEFNQIIETSKKAIVEFQNEIKRAQILLPVFSVTSAAFAVAGLVMVLKNLKKQRIDKSVIDSEE